MKSAEIRTFAPDAKPELVDAIVRNWPGAEEAGIVSPLRTAHFFAQIATETGGLRSISESLNYKATALTQMFPRRITVAQANRYGRTANHPADQQAIANIIYGGAWGKKNLGNTEPDDGWRYRGGGMLQTTGRANYAALGHDDDPEALRDPDRAFKTAIAEWKKRGCNKLADADDVVGVRKKINGGTNGLVECKSYLRRAKRAFANVQPHVSALVDEPAAESRLTRTEIEAYQIRLIAHGYHMVGIPDGKMGKMTVGAIAAFQRANGIAVSGNLDEETRKELDEEPEVIPVSPERASVSVADLKAQGSRTIDAADKAEIAPKVGLFGSIGLGGMAAVSETFGSVRGYLEPAWDMLGSVPMWLWFVVIAGVSGYIVFQTQRVKRYRVEDVRSGKFVGLPGRAIVPTDPELLPAEE